MSPKPLFGRNQEPLNFNLKLSLTNLILGMRSLVLKVNWNIS